MSGVSPDDDLWKNDEDYRNGYEDGWHIGYDAPGTETESSDPRYDDESSSYGSGYDDGVRDGEEDDSHRYDDPKD